MEKTYYVYRHRTTTDNRVYYVGFGNKKRPFEVHKSRRSKDWLNIYHNEGLIVEILHITEDEDLALELEELFIREYGRICDGGSLTNKALFKGTGGVNYSEETIRNMSESQKGKNLSVDTKRKIGESQKKTVLQYTKDGDFIKEYDSVKIAAKELNLKSPTGISMVCNGIRKTSGGFIWKYKEEKDL